MNILKLTPSCKDYLWGGIVLSELVVCVIAMAFYRNHRK